MNDMHQESPVEQPIQIYLYLYITKALKGVCSILIKHKKLSACFYKYRISSFKRRGVYLFLELLGVAFIRGQRLFRKSK